MLSVRHILLANNILLVSSNATFNICIDSKNHMKPTKNITRRFCLAKVLTNLLKKKRKAYIIQERKEGLYPACLQ